jgi:hypothetical protein
MTPARFPHSDTPGSTLGCQLPRAYRRLLRPSSALDAKASTTCPFQLVTHTTNPTPHPPQANPTQANPHGCGARAAAHTTRHKRTTHPQTINRGHAQNNNRQPTPHPTHTHSAHTLHTQALRTGTLHTGTLHTGSLHTGTLHTGTLHKAGGRAGAARGFRASHQMLASTIQISNNNPTPPADPHRGRPRSRATDTRPDRDRAGCRVVLKPQTRRHRRG